MDINTVTSFRTARTRADLVLAPGEVFMAGGTWLMSEPQPGTTGFIDLTTLGWPDLEVTDAGLRIGATCTIAHLVAWAKGEGAPIMQGKTVVVTGGTSGIGEVAALRLAGMGARIVLIARDRARTDATLAKLKAANPAVAHAAHLADLSSIAEMKRVAAEVAAAEPRIDVLINNAGAVFTTRQLSVDGLEMTFAVNHMAYFVVTNVLLPNLKATPGARVVSTASTAHSAARLDFADLQLEKGFSTFRAYGNSKLCNILFTRELARRLEGTGVTANSLHPGGVNTRFGSNNSGFIAALFKVAMGIFGIAPEEGAKTIIHLASSPDVATISGEYFYKCKIVDPTPAAQDDASARRLWDASAKLAGVG